jgi:hypothetical protein
MSERTYNHNACFSIGTDAHEQLRILAADSHLGLSAYLRQMIRQEYNNYQKREELLMDDLLTRIT